MDSPCSVNRRQAWAQCSRHWLTVEDAELHASASNTAAAQISLQDEVFPDGRHKQLRVYTLIFWLQKQMQKWHRLECCVRH